MTQFPILVETGRSHVTSILTVPEGEIRGVVVSLAATGRHNMIGSTFCAHISSRLVDHGLASVRFDYGGVGDSPGLVRLWTPADVDAALQQARAVVAESMAVLGVTRFATVGTCYGTRVALGLVPDPKCVGAVCLAPPVLDYAGLSRVGRRIGERKALSFLRSSPVARRLVAPLRRTVSARKPAPGVMAAFGFLGRTRIAFLYGKDPFEDHYDQQAREALDSVLASLPQDRREHFELRMLPWGPLTTFDILSPADKEAVLDVVNPLLRAAFTQAAPVSVVTEASMSKTR